MALSSWSSCLCSPGLGSAEYTTTYDLVLFSKLYRWMETVVRMKAFMLYLRPFWHIDATMTVTLSSQPVALSITHSTQHSIGNRSQKWPALPQWLWQENSIRSELQSTHHYCHSELRVRDHQTNLPLKLGDI